MSEPFLKWAGGKRWLVQRYRSMFPAKFTRYIEPFVGSGAVFFHLSPPLALLGDRNKELINTYRAVKTHADELASYLKKYDKLHGEKFYYGMRKTIPPSPVERAARFLYLNRACFNGLYRVNLKNEFNVPIGSKVTVELPDGLLQSAAKALRRVQLKVSDFEAIINQAESGDFVYIDPPYTVMHNNNGFIKYNDVIFSWSDQIRLANTVHQASKRGAFIFVSNANHVAINDLYASFCFQHKLTRSTHIAGKSIARCRITEAAFLNYAVPQAYVDEQLNLI